MGRLPLSALSGRRRSRHAVEIGAAAAASPVTRELDRAAAWLAGGGDAVDGVVARRVGESYKSGERAMQKVKRVRSADCVVGGFRYATGGPSRWTRGRDVAWQPLKPELVLEVTYDHFSGGRFRHGTRFQRWRPDKAPEQCRMSQVESEGRISPRRLLQTTRASRAVKAAGRTGAGRKRAAS